MAGAYDEHLARNAANHQPLSPLSFIERTAAVFPDRPSVIDGERRFTWAETYARCRRLAGALKARGVAPGDTVAVVAPNVTAIYEAHFGVAMAGAVLNTINTRLDAPTIGFILDHGAAKAVICDTELSEIMRPAIAAASVDPLVIDVAGPTGERLGAIEYEDFLAEGDPDTPWSWPADEWDAISLNYTSGTTGNPKGVVYHHRGAFLTALGNQMVWGMPRHPRYLWTLPMFHCNGWCFPWTVAALAGVSVCLRRVEPGAVFSAIAEHKVTHLCGAPVVLNMLLNAKAEEKAPFDHRVEIMTAASPPPAAVIERMEREGFGITHVYGLTETYGPAVVCAWHDEWDAEPPDTRAALKARQGVRYPMLEQLMVADPETLAPVPRDGEALGEVLFRGNIVMKGYLKNPSASDEAFAGGWFHSGDLAVWHEDGYIELKDRSKDIIISGGENISSIEVENALYRHPAVLEAAVTSRPDAQWGETPCAFVTLRDGARATEDEIIAFCRDNMAHYKAPRTVVFGPLPKTSTGKVQKFILREQARSLGERTE